MGYAINWPRCLQAHVSWHPYCERGEYEAGPLISMVGKEEVPHRRFSKTKKQGNMKQVTKVSPGAKKNALSRLLTPTLAIVAAATALLPTNNAMADEIDLTAVGVDQTQTVTATYGGN